MNERIKLLADQLGPVATIGNWGRVEWSDNVYPQLGDRMYAAIDLQKFAELIVSECVRRIEGCSIDPTQYEFDRDRAFIEGYNKAISKSASQVLLHFGVEE